MSKFKDKIIRFVPTKRRLIQLYAALLFNANLKGFVNGKIYQGPLKNICTPGLNCYSCPGASGACPLGALQNSLSSSTAKAPYYVIGIILLYGLLFGRWICGFLCPFGLIQELLHKIKTPKLKKGRITKILSYFKYVLLVLLVIIFPLIYAFKNFPLPGFCKYICPAGTLEGAIGLLSNFGNDELFGMLGPLFTWKFVLLVVFVVGSVFIYRFFCRFFCPLGAIYGLFNKISFIGIKLDAPKCTDCGKCVSKCKMDISRVGDHECINCGECISSCPTKAISWKGPKVFVKSNEIPENTEDAAKAVSKIQKRNNIIKITSFVLAGALLIGSLVYYNFIDKVPTVEIPQGNNTAPPSTEIDAVPGYNVGDICYTTDIRMINGSSETFNLVNNRGKITVINFWGEWCGPCIQELPYFEEIAQNYSETVTVVALHSEYNKSKAEDYINLNYPDSAMLFGYDDNDTYYTMLGFSSTYPTTLVIDQNGIIVGRYVGSVSYKDLSGHIEDCLEEGSDNSDLIYGFNEGELCYSIDLRMINGDQETFNLSNNKGKITVINFWGEWCGPCIQELPYFEKIAQNYSETVTVVALHSEYNKSKALNYINSNYPNSAMLFGYDDNDTYYTMLGFSSTYPTTLIVDKNGVIIARYVGSVTYDKLAAHIEACLTK